MLKKSILLSSLAYVIFVAITFLISVNCESAWCTIRDDDIIGILITTFSPLALVFLLSLVTYKMREEVFRAWWNIAVWFTPLIVVVTFIQNYSSHSGGSGISSVVNDSFNYFVLGLLYLIFVVVSAFRIVTAYRNDGSYRI